MGRKIEIVMEPQPYFSRGRSYTMRSKHAEQARLAAEQRMELERSGELERRRLGREAQQLKWKIEELKQLEYVDHEIMEFINRVLDSYQPTTTWLEQATAAYPAITAAQADRKRAAEEASRKRQAEEAARWAEVLDEAFAEVQDLLAKIQGGDWPTIGGLTMVKADQLKCAGRITDKEHELLTKAEQRAYLSHRKEAEGSTREVRWLEKRYLKHPLDELTPLELLEAKWDKKIASDSSSKDEEQKHINLSYNRGHEVRHRNIIKLRRSMKMTKQEFRSFVWSRRNLLHGCLTSGQHRSDQRRIWRRETRDLRDY